MEWEEDSSDCSSDENYSSNDDGLEYNAGQMKGEAREKGICCACSKLFSEFGTEDELSEECSCGRFWQRIWMFLKNLFVEKFDKGAKEHRKYDCLCTEAPQFGPHKVILVGDSGVGKSSFMLRLCDDAFNEKMNPSFGLDFKTKVIPVNGTEESIQIWDTAGQERFRSITQSYFRKVDGIILVYDITHEESFLNLQSWVSCIQESGQLTAPITIVGNKLDLEHLRCVTREMATELADFYEAEFVEVSAKNGKNINEVGYELVRKLVEQRTLNSKQAAELPFPVSRPSASDCTETTCSCVIL